MNNLVDIADDLQKSQDKATDIIKTWIFDILGLVVIIAAMLISLGALKIIKVTWQTVLDLFISFVPYYFAAVLLANNYYTKGTFKGKATNKYITALTAYSERAASLTGHQMQVLPDFCQEFNEKALHKIQDTMLRKVSIDFNLFDKPCEENNNLPLKIQTKKQLLQLYNKDVIKVIRHAKKVSVKGISENLLLSTIKSYDDTDIGKNETELAKQNRLRNIITFFFSMFLLSFIGFKDVNEWGWIGAALVLFKMTWIFVKSYSQFFRGYNNITINIIAHIVRKDDILKQFEYWYSCKFSNLNV